MLITIEPRITISNNGYTGILKLFWARNKGGEWCKPKKTGVPIKNPLLFLHNYVGNFSVLSTGVSPISVYDVSFESQGQQALF